MILSRIKNFFSFVISFSLGNRQRTVLRNGFFVCLALRCLVTASLAYQYVIYASQTTDTKGGTLVEAVPRPISFLPYLSNEDEDHFYQSLLFHSCIVTKPGTMNVEFKESLCKITTTDNVSYVISVNPDVQWRDGVPVTAQDVFFTYNEIIRNNTRQIPYLESYEKIIVTLTPDQKVRVTFPGASIDNTLFFTKFILPAHILEYKTLTYYKDLFSRNIV
jgi:ABC-type transport system substrate-binding protein